MSGSSACVKGRCSLERLLLQRQPCRASRAAHTEGAVHRQLCLSPECPGCCLAFPLPGELCVQTSVAAPGMPQCSKLACHRVT